MSTEARILKNPDTRIILILRPIISERSGDPHCKSPFIPQEDINIGTSLKKFDYLDIYEMGMAFEKEYIAQTGKKFWIEEEDFDVLAKINHVGEFCYALHCCIEGKPIPHEPSKAEKLKTKLNTYKQNIKNVFAQRFIKSKVN